MEEGQTISIDISIEKKTTGGFSLEEIQQRTPEFSYDSLANGIQSHTIINLTAKEHPAYKAVSLKDFIIFFSDRENNLMPSPEGIIFQNYGLKFHISLPEKNLNQRKQGWDIVRNTLFEYGVKGFKIIKPGLNMSDLAEQRGKDITIYANYNPEKTIKDWQELLTVLTQRLVEARVPPGYRVQSTQQKPERTVLGSNYISYRYEDEKMEKYHKNKNVWPKDDPCSKIKIDVLRQPEPMVWTDSNRSSLLDLFTPKV